MSVCVCVCVSVCQISLEPLVRWISNLTGDLLQARVSEVLSLTLFGLKMQKILVNISVKEAHTEVVVEDLCSIYL